MLGDDAYTYPGSRGVLRNKLNITDGRELEEAENAFVSVTGPPYANAMRSLAIEPARRATSARTTSRLAPASVAGREASPRAEWAVSRPARSQSQQTFTPVSCREGCLRRVVPRIFV